MRSTVAPCFGSIQLHLAQVNVEPLLGKFFRAHIHYGGIVLVIGSRQKVYPEKPRVRDLESNLGWMESQERFERP